MKIGSLLGTKPYSPTRLNENENRLNYCPVYTVLLRTSRSAMFFWATRRALGETGSRHASCVILSRLSTVRVAFSPALEQFTRYMLFHACHVTIPLLLEIVDYGVVSMSPGVILMVHGNFMYYILYVYCLYK